MGGETFLRWAGSKKRIIPVLREYWNPNFNRYIEPFMGSAVLYYALKPSAAILSDINHELITTFLAVRDHPRAVHNRISKIRQGKRNYYKLRELDPMQLEPLDRAARFIFLNRFCFNGLYRTNNQGKYNVPFSPSKTGKLPSWEKLFEASKTLKSATICHGDFESILRSNVEAGDFVYMDPPYATSNSRIFQQYGPDSFGISDIERLKQLLSYLDDKDVAFVLSYGWCTEAKDAFSDWSMKKISVQRNISGFSAHRRKATEVIISNISNA